MHFSPRVLHFQYSLHLPTSKFNHDIARNLSLYHDTIQPTHRRGFCTLQRIRFFLIALQPSHHRYDLISSRGKRMRERRFIRPTRRPRPFCVSCAPPTGRRAKSRGMRNARGIHAMSKGLRTHLSGSADREKRDQSIPSWTLLSSPAVNDAILCPSSLRCIDRSRCLAIEPISIVVPPLWTL